MQSPVLQYCAVCRVRCLIQYSTSLELVQASNPKLASRTNHRSSAGTLINNAYILLTCKELRSLKAVKGFLTGILPGRLIPSWVTCPAIVP